MSILSVAVRSRHLVAALALLVSAVVAPLAAQQVDDDLVYGLRSGDRITISFYTAAGEELVEVAGERIVDRNGEIFLPFVGTVTVEGLDATQIRTRLVELYSSFYTDPVIDVVAELRVNVTGAVRAPGNYYMDPSSTILDAVSAAGGSGLDIGGFGVGGGTLPANASATRLVRSGQTEIIDLSPAGASLETVSRRIESGDWIYVPPARQSRLRQEVLFWGNVVGVLVSVVSIIVLVSR